MELWLAGLFLFRLGEAFEGFGDEFLEEVEIVEVVDAKHVALGAGVG